MISSSHVAQDEIGYALCTLVVMQPIPIATSFNWLATFILSYVSKYKTKVTSQVNSLMM